MMDKIILAVGFVLLFSSPLLAQRDAPVWECYLPRVEIYHDQNASITLDFTFKKNGGPYEHVEHQCYVFAYLTVDEAEIFKLAADPKLLNKNEKNEKPIIDVLLDKKLIAKLDTKAAKLSLVDGRTQQFPDTSGNPSGAGKEKRDDYTFPFQFTFSNQTLYASVSQLAHSEDDAKPADKKTPRHGNAFKFLVFVPVNDSKYADKISAELRGKYDFTRLSRDTILLYFRPLPYECQCRKNEGKLIVYIN